MADIGAMLRDCEEAAKTPLHRGGTDYNEWEREFLASVREQYDAAPVLSDAQLAKLVELWERS